MLLRTETREPPVRIIAGIPASTWRMILLGVGLVIVVAIP